MIGVTRKTIKDKGPKAPFFKPENTVASYNSNEYVDVVTIKALI